ncbi:Oxygen-independent coproporphyrinogen-III oxidase 2 [Pseudodesulfovibrio hydrargyri]|uniref:Oxygen-independent coproporphyrinogen-III oxidase 2 n=1 Tax=Pseudodesulfovibrio hydrargyri TaxID=2125990 RepID=A0A1J5MTX7_9BACT|nr:radical SAM protein [Pseudodesulfovibrio hydrargyri]OIQ50085.1 Oxygen-independent coproporphyrinogen-III oxidase 2 [Pseudodesulfovibrio hydrargyri]
MRFAHPEPVPASVRVWPVFLPFAGCPYRCLFCAQDKQTGRDHADLAAILDGLKADLHSALERGHGPYELAFYGGTFTALPAPWPETFLALAARFRELGLISRVRCSTRPDCVAPDGLSRLASLGLDMVELGIQSFDDEALRASGRGYSGKVARAACRIVNESGLALGIQLLPGLPGDRPGLFRADVRAAADLRPETARLYPCLVVRGTPLADLWERGGYVPWTTDRAVRELAEALPVLWAEGVRVIRLGLAPEPTLDENVLAGPRHPALGQSARALALFEVVKDKVRELGRRPSLLEVPRRYSGEFFGHARELAPAYFELGVAGDSIRFAESELFFLE